jgi:hypothetical protein
LDKDKNGQTKTYGPTFYWGKGDSGDKNSDSMDKHGDSENKDGDSENKDGDSENKDGDNKNKDDIESMVLKMCRKHKAIKDGLKEQGVITVNPGGSISIKGKKVRHKLFLDNDIKCSNIATSVKLLLEHCDETDDLALFIKKLME